MTSNIKNGRSGLNFWRKLTHYANDGLSGKEPTMSKLKNADAGRFVTVTSSGSVTVDVGGFLKSNAGQKQIEQIKELRDFTRNNSAPKPENKKVG